MPSSERERRLAIRRERRLKAMAAFCKYWGMTPAEYKALTVEELNALTEFANNEIRERNRQAKKKGR